MDYTVTIEAEGYGSPGSEADALGAAIPGELESLIDVDERRGMIRVRMIFDAGDGAEAHDQASTIFNDAWDEAMSADRPTMRLAIVARPFSEEEDNELREAIIEAEHEEPAVA